MAKLLITAFFLVRVGFYALVRYAKIGWQAVEKYTRDIHLPAATTLTDVGSFVPNHDKLFAIAKVIIQTLHVQAGFIADSGGILPAAAKDRWSCGYVAGFCGAALQRAGIVDQIEAFALLAIVFKELFGKVDGPALNNSFHANRGDEETEAGVMVGGTEHLDWLQDAKSLPAGFPMGWGNHAKGVTPSRG